MRDEDQMMSYMLAIAGFAITVFVMFVTAVGAAFVLHAYGVIDGPF